MEALRQAYLRAGVGAPTAPGKPARPWHVILASVVGANFVWANYNSVNYQIVLYLFSRITVGLVRLLAEKNWWPFRLANFDSTYPRFAVFVWAVVMYLFEYHPGVLQGSLHASMVDIYTQANSWSKLSDFVPNVPTAVVLAYMFYLARGSISKLLSRQNWRDA